MYEMIALGGYLLANFPIPDVNKVPDDRGRRGHLRRNKVRASAASLTALEVAVRRRSAALARRKDVRVHAQAHGAARLAPIEAGFLEDAVEAFLLGLSLDLLRARDHHRVDMRGNLVS